MSDDRVAELGTLRKKEADLSKRAENHIDEANLVIDTLFQEIDEAQKVIERCRERRTAKIANPPVASDTRTGAMPDAAGSRRMAGRSVGGH